MLLNTGDSETNGGLHTLLCFMIIRLRKIREIRENYFGNRDQVSVHVSSNTK